MSIFIIPLIITSSLTKINNSYSLQNNFKTEKKLTEFLLKINDGYRTIYEVCDSIDSSKSKFFNLNNPKPSCIYNMSYIKNDKTIIIHSIHDSIRNFIFDNKNIHCNRQQIECETYGSTQKTRNNYAACKCAESYS